MLSLKQLFAGALLIVFWGLSASAAQAQNVDLQDIIGYLGPRQQTLLWDILIYACFLFSLLTMFSLSDKQLLPTLLMGATLMALLIIKLTISAAGASEFLPDPEDQIGGLIVLLLLVAVFIFPLMSGAMTKSKRGKPLGIFSGILGGVLFVAYGLFRLGWFGVNPIF